MAKIPTDQFDDLPADLARVGAHRAPPRAGRGWITFAWAALFTGLFVVAGTLGLNALRGLSFLGEPPTSSATPSAEITADPVLDPTTIDPARAISITVLNGTTTVDLEKTAGAALLGTGWPVGATLVATNRTEPTTIVYYGDPANEDIARGLVLALGTGEIRESTAYSAPITIVLGSDYTGTPAT
jgi:hypothetical protein